VKGWDLQMPLPREIPPRLETGIHAIRAGFQGILPNFCLQTEQHSVAGSVGGTKVHLSPTKEPGGSSCRESHRWHTEHMTRHSDMALTQMPWY
jgi:hypothetical protein